MFRSSAILLLMACVVRSAAGATWYVDVDHPSGGNGLSWANAFNDLQAALQNQNLQSGDIIRVAQGTYVPSTTADRTASFAIPREITLRGGYAGYDQTNPDARDFRNFQTTLSGDLGSTNSYHVVATGASGPQGQYAKINGFHITGGVADGGVTNYHDRGGGVTVKGLTKIINCYFYDNEAEQQGGAINCDQSSEIINCVFINNRSDQDGGAVCLDEGGPSTILNCVFNNNYADRHGGAVCSTRHVDAVILESTFVHNKCEDNGSAVHGNYDPTSSEELQLLGCIVWNNRQTSGNANNQITVAPASTSPLNVSVRISKSTLENLTNHFSGIVGNNNTNDDDNPLFRDIDGPNNTAGDQDDDFRLSIASPQSPAIDTGYVLFPQDEEDVDDDSNLTEPTPDLNGHHRIVGALTDKGAFETGCDGDIDNNLNVDVFDLFILLSNWGSCSSPCPPVCQGDLTNSTSLGPDCTVDVFDLFMLLSSWGNCVTGVGQVPQSVSDCLNWYETGSVEQMACLEAFQKLQEE